GGARAVHRGLQHGGRPASHGGRDAQHLPGRADRRVHLWSAGARAARGARIAVRRHGVQGGEERGEVPHPRLRAGACSRAPAHPRRVLAATPRAAPHP
ncbi:unnamed protein product, partial [Ectocarpus fasciculatus]